MLAIAPSYWPPKRKKPPVRYAVAANARKDGRKSNTGNGRKPKTLNHTDAGYPASDRARFRYLRQRRNSQQLLATGEAMPNCANEVKKRDERTY